MNTEIKKEIEDYAGSFNNVDFNKVKEEGLITKFETTKVCVKSEICQQTFSIKNEVEDIDIKLEQLINKAIDIKDDFIGTAITKKFECQVCNKKFSFRGGLTVHSKIHTGEKPYKCKVCNKIFRQSGNLKNHMATHTGEKQYECDVCGYKFLLNLT